MNRCLACSFPLDGTRVLTDRGFVCSEVCVELLKVLEEKVPPHSELEPLE